MYSYQTNLNDYLQFFDNNKTIFFLHTVFESIVPSTLAFTIINFFQDLFISLQKHTKYFLFNSLSLLIAFFLELVYCFTAPFPTNILLIILNIILIILDIVFTVLAYSETYKLTHRNHSLV